LAKLLRKKRDRDDRLFDIRRVSDRCVILSRTCYWENRLVMGDWNPDNKYHHLLATRVAHLINGIDQVVEGTIHRRIAKLETMTKLQALWNVMRQYWDTELTRRQETDPDPTYTATIKWSEDKLLQALWEWSDPRKNANMDPEVLLRALHRRQPDHPAFVHFLYPMETYDRNPRYIQYFLDDMSIVMNMRSFQVGTIGRCDEHNPAEMALWADKSKWEVNTNPFVFEIAMGAFIACEQGESARRMAFYPYDIVPKSSPWTQWDTYNKGMDYTYIDSGNIVHAQVHRILLVHTMKELFVHLPRLPGPGEDEAAKRRAWLSDVLTLRYQQCRPQMIDFLLSVHNAIEQGTKCDATNVSARHELRTFVLKTLKVVVHLDKVTQFHLVPHGASVASGQGVGFIPCGCDGCRDRPYIIPM
jgi:hypothetical protein